MRNKKTILIIICVVLIFCILQCVIFFPELYNKFLTKDGDTSKVNIIPIESDYYSTDDFNEAVNIVLKEFKKFKGCTLEKIEYIGDKQNNKEIHWAKDNDKEEAITLILSFKTGKFNEVEGLNSNSYYSSYHMILIRNKDERWILVASGY